MDVKMPETCWDTIDWINHYLLHLVRLVLIQNYSFVKLTTRAILHRTVLLWVCLTMSLVSSVNIVTRLQINDWELVVWLPGGPEIFLFSKISRLYLGSAWSPIHWVSVAIFPWSKSGQDVQLPTHLHLVWSLKMHGTTPPLFHQPQGWCPYYRKGTIFSIAFHLK
jgi:hypothetical protein